MTRPITRFTERCLQTVSMGSLAVLTIFIVVQIAARSVDIPFYWADELTGILFAVSVFFALPIVTKNQDHLKVDFLLPKLPESGRTWFLILIDVICFIYFLALTILISLLAYDSFLVNAKSQGMLRIPQFYPQAALIIGLVISLIFLVIKFSRNKRP